MKKASKASVHSAQRSDQFMLLVLHHGVYADQQVSQPLVRMQNALCLKPQEARAKKASKASGRSAQHSTSCYSHFCICGVFSRCNRAFRACCVYMQARR